jgi:hypothetical protein
MFDKAFPMEPIALATGASECDYCGAKGDGSPCLAIATEFRPPYPTSTHASRGRRARALLDNYYRHINWRVWHFDHRKFEEGY